MTREKESPQKGVSKYWTAEAEEYYKRLIASCRTFVERDLTMTIRDLLKYDLRTREAKRAVEQGRLRLAVATDEDLEELVRLQCQMRGGEFVSPEKKLEELKALRTKTRERRIRLIKVSNHICSKCERTVEVPDWDDIEPFYKYFRRWERAVLKHGWLYHREDFPPQFKSFSQFMRWITTSEGRAWDEKQGVLIEAEEILREAQQY